MGLFAQEPGSQAVPTRTQRYTGWTREIGTRNIIIWFVVIVAGWYLIGRVQDHFLLQAHWGDLKPQMEGLTIVGTLDSKEYEHNLYRVVTANQTSRVELTEYGYNTIFSEKNGPLFDPSIGDAIHAVQSLDNETSYRMLEPYLRAGVARALGRADWTTMVSRSMPITIQVAEGKTMVPQVTTLGALLAKYSKEESTKENPEASDTPEGGSASGRTVDHGLPIPADSLAVTSPIVLVGSDFTGADFEEHPASVFDGKTVTVTLHLSSEGRSRFFQWSSKHENENLVFVLQHRVVAAGRIKQKMDVSSWEIGPLHDVETAKALVEYVNGLKR